LTVLYVILLSLHDALPILPVRVLVHVMSMRGAVAAAQAVMAHGLRPVLRITDAGSSGFQQGAQVLAALAADEDHESLEVGRDQARQFIEHRDLALSIEPMAGGRAVVQDDIAE